MKFQRGLGQPGQCWASRSTF